MGHQICALVVADPVDADRAGAVDLRVQVALAGTAVLPVDHYYSAYWAARRGEAGSLDVPAGLPPVFPTDAVLADLVRDVTGASQPRFAIVLTEYFGGAGEQWAVAFRGSTRLTGVVSINEALAAAGVRARPPLDGFDTVGLDSFRENPAYLDRYVELCAELGI